MYDQLMTTVTKLEGTVVTLTETVSSLHGTIGTLESRLLALDGDARVSTLTQTVPSYRGDERDFGMGLSIGSNLYFSGGRQKRCRSGEDLRWLNRSLVVYRYITSLCSVSHRAIALESHINAFIELMMRKRPHNAQWTLGLSELVAFHIDSGMRLSMVSVVDALRATIDGTNPRYPSWHKISQVFFPINLGNKHWVAAAWNLDDYVLMVYDSLESPENGEKIVDLLKIWKDFIKKDLENMNWFENTKRDPKCFKISLRYKTSVPKQSFIYGTLDCGVMTLSFS
ncbi:phospholipase-like protein [Tanacetum coccineum]|uniref:Phospholipase-like protein n=1 Tax=Tanacetum coccineum TaxID=301880 RepID=A0ABQ5BZC5_9ASTR